MMRALLPLLFFFGLPFWQTKPPEKWSDLDIDEILHNSPWAQTTGPSPEVLVYLATAGPVEDAEEELRLRSKDPLPEPDPDYAAYISDNGDKALVLAIPYPAHGTAGIAKPDELHTMEEESVMIVGHKTYQILGYFPPMSTDPVLRLVFPRVVRDTDKNVVFRLYLAGISFPEREVQFRVKDLMYHGRLAM